MDKNIMSRSNTGEKILTPFASYLKIFLSNKEINDRNFWADLLEVSQSAISQWVNGKTTPLPKQLNRIISILYDFRNINNKIHTEFKDFLKLLDINIIKSQRKKFKNHNTIGDYIVEPKVNTLVNSISLLPFEIKNELVLAVNRLINNISLKINSSDNSIELIFRKINELDCLDENELNIDNQKNNSDLGKDKEIILSNLINKYYEKLIYISSSIVNDYNLSEKIVNDIFENIAKEDTSLWLIDVINHFNGNIEVALFRKCKMMSLKVAHQNNKSLGIQFEEKDDKCIHNTIIYDSAQSKYLNKKEKIVLQSVLIDGLNHSMIASNNNEIKSETESIVTYKTAKRKIKDIFID